LRKFVEYVILRLYFYRGGMLIRQVKWNKFWTILICLITAVLICSPALAAAHAERVYGMNKFQTSVQVAYKINPGTVYNVVLANGNGFADALAGVPLARQKKAPLLLVDNKPENSSDALLYIQKHLDPEGQIYLLGGTAVIDDSFVERFKDMGYKSDNIHRLAGADRYATAVEVAKQIEHDGIEFFLVSGENFPDALSASVAASLLGSITEEEAKYLSAQGIPTSPELGGVPLLLLPSDGSVPDCVVNYLNSLNPWLRNAAGKQSQYFNIVGGQSVIPDAVVNDLINRMKYSGSVRYRYQGADRYATSAAVNRIGFEAYYANQGKGRIIPQIFVATGEDYPDALTGAVLAALNHAPLVLTADPIPAATEQLLFEYKAANLAQGHNDIKVTIIGNTDSITDNLKDKITELLN
jgi:putative cell wall-binding protein